MNDGVKDADETAVDEVAIDLVVDEVDGADLISAFQVELIYPSAGAGAVSVTAVDTAGQMISANPGSVPVSQSDAVPDSVSPFIVAAEDVGVGPGAYELGEGVLARITLSAWSGPSLGQVSIGALNTFVLDQNGASIPITNLGRAVLAVDDFCPTVSDLEIVQETVVGPSEIGAASADYTIQKIVRNVETRPPQDGTITTVITPPAYCDTGAGPGNPYTIVTAVPALAFGVDVAVDVPFQVQCSNPGVYDSEFAISNEIQVTDPVDPPDVALYNNTVLHQTVPGSPPPLILTPAGSPGPALKLHVVNCAPVPPWPAPPGDGDCDGFTDAEEAFVGTDAADACPDSPDDDAWPADLASALPPPDNGYGKHDGTVNIVDIFRLTPPVFNSNRDPNGDGDFSDADPYYTTRKDFNGDGAINIVDIFRLTPPVFNSTCTP